MDALGEVADLLFGGGGDELITKMEPTQSDLASKDRKKRAMTAGLSAVGATAGAAGLALGAHNISRSYKLARGGEKLASAGKHVARAGRHAGVMKPMGRGAALKHAVGREKLATGLIPLEVAGLGGEVMATKILHSDTKKKQGTLQPVSKGEPDILNNVKEVPKSKGALTRALLTNPKVQKKGVEYTKQTGGLLKKLPEKVTTTNEVEKGFFRRKKTTKSSGSDLNDLLKLERENVSSGGHMAKPVRDWQRKNPGKDWQTGVQKSDDAEIDVVWDAEISKADPDKQQIFGWASVVEVNGEPIVDLQGDRISAEEMEKAGYEYVMKSRKGGDMHLRNNWEPIQKSEMIESFIVTEDKRQAMGLPDSVPTGWWVGFQVRDPAVWNMVKSGERTGFSIHGHGRRT